MRQDAQHHATVEGFARRPGIWAAFAGGLTCPQRAAGYADSLEAVVVNLVLGCEPLYALAAWGQDAQVAAGLGDDKAGRALEALWDADPVGVCARAGVSAARAASVRLAEVHNDSTSVRLWGSARRPDRSGGTPRAPRGRAKDHRPDLKQLVARVSVPADGRVPLAFRLVDGNTEDSTTHIDSLDELAGILGTTRFTYVADCKFATGANLAHIAAHAGAVFVAVLPKGRTDCDGRVSAIPLARRKPIASETLPRSDRLRSNPIPRSPPHRPHNGCHYARSNTSARQLMALCSATGRHVPACCLKRSANRDSPTTQATNMPSR
ncbi:MAG: hypothetical protein LBK59_12560 [Bifidobacteriaceae bacterium]|jgi:hypothetical protein|nr:hypothetical protein [Bifidobacteriaceae bacterium]